MYFLSKFCRICIKTNVKLVDINSVDFDQIKLSKKLEVCTKMVVSRESLSTEICVNCLAKLRISYQFQDMCKKSTKILQGYLTELIGESNKIDPNEFINTELSVVVTPIISHVTVQHNKQELNKRKQRITKEQRCSLLKQLLTPSHKVKKERDKYLHPKYQKGGLKNIIDFTKNYEFGLKLDKNSNIETSPLDKLKAFSKNFFPNDFTEFRNTILYIIENKDKLYDSSLDSDDESIFDDTNEEINEEIVRFEEVIVEPDIKIKSELMDYEEEGECSYSFVEAEYNIQCKIEENDDPDEPETQLYLTNNESSLNNMPNIYNDYRRLSVEHATSSNNPSMQLLDNLVSTYPLGGCRKTFSPHSVRCRTRNNPYINPTLKDQFLHRSFRCDKCNRYFKSPGYLKAHNSKIHF